MTTTLQLAEELHRFYRAAFKALHGTVAMAGGFEVRSQSHDHGWSHCNKKKYFLRRAELLLRDLNDHTYRTLRVKEQGNFGGILIDPYPAKLSTPTITKEGLGHVGQD